MEECLFIVAVFQNKCRKIKSGWDIEESLSQTKVWAKNEEEAKKKGVNIARKEGFKIKMSNVLPLVGEAFVYQESTEN